MALDPPTRIEPGTTARSSESQNGSDPADFEQVVKLGADRLVLRRIRPEDCRAYSGFIAGIDESDLRSRFGPAAGVTPETDLALHTPINDECEIAFVAVRQSGQRGEEIVGEVRAYRYPEGASAEVAIIVRSDMKGRGLGRALMEKMIGYCRANGLEMIAQILPKNKPMIRLAERCGMQLEHPPGSNRVIAHMA
jgi:acetyltransferase